VDDARSTIRDVSNVSDAITRPSPNTPLDRRAQLRLAIGVSLFLAATTVGLRLEGRRWWCRCGKLFLWSGGIHSEHGSQHLLDPYSFTHLLHGLILYAIARPLTGRLRFGGRLLLVIAVEALWELAENSEMVIDRYRKATIALGYAGDSVVNSLGDIASCLVGVYLAARLPVRWSIALFVTVEAVLLLLYRDNLTLNVLMLVWPLKAVKVWQQGG
jgi:Protein of unknown function (DUF2585)